jgi:hypothetical protein
MSKFDIPTFTATCPACAAESLHRVVLETPQVRHLRCDGCNAPHVCATRGSYKSTIVALSIDDLVASATQGEVDAYSIHSAFHPTDIFSHPKFGMGYVFAILSPPKKMEVLFSDQVRFLVCGPGSGIYEAQPEEEGQEEDQEEDQKEGEIEEEEHAGTNDQTP